MRHPTDQPGHRGQPGGDVMQMGLDIGSTTVKLVVLDDAGLPVFSEYRRHHADVRGEVTRLLEEARRELDGVRVRGAVTGSAGLSLAQLMGLPFVQEVIAETETVRRRDPATDVIIELGGEDAKITYLHPTPEQRMNGTCAGGTGAFIDQMAQLLHTDVAGLNDLAARHRSLYPIASRCGVFAKSDLQPLINQGAEPADLAASVLQAVVTQTIAGLACGRPIRGNVMFLGGPLHFLPELRAAFERNLADQVDDFRCPPEAQLYVAIGAALLATGETVTLEELGTRLATRRSLELGTSRMRPLFADEAERRAFAERHARATVARAPWPTIGARDEDPHDDARAAGAPEGDFDCFLGIDAGSTTIKAVVLDSADRIVWEHYAGNEGDPVTAAVEILRRIHREAPEGVRIVRSCVTGYGESLVKAALHIDEGVVETMAHYRAAEHLNPGVTLVIDIGGQDMKYLRIRGGAIDSICVNEACSSGCGSFLQTFAQTMGTTVEDFAAAALEAEHPVDLGSRCTVFMNSSVKQAQREAATVGEISAGLSYSVVRNALYKVIKLKDADQLGERVSVQGGTFLNDAVLRAFELLTGREVVRPDAAGLMGALGAALTAHATYDAEPSALMGLGELSRFSLSTEATTCRLCQNHCRLTITTFNDGQRHVSGNRCERGAAQERRASKSEVPNLYEYKYRRTFSYRRLREADAPRGDIGVPRVLGMYENYPLWFTVLTSLGFRVIISGRSSHELFESGMDAIPSENVCYPAKLAHGHVESLVAKGVRTIWFPCVFYERELVAGADNHFNCPIVATYPEVIRANTSALRTAGAPDDPARAAGSARAGQDRTGASGRGAQQGGDRAAGGQGDGVRLLAPFLNLADPTTLARRLVEVFADWGVTLPEARRAVAAGFAEDAAFKADVRAEGRRTLEWMEANGRKGIVLAGRPYHVDPEINHGIPDVINTLGMAVLSEDSILPEPEAQDDDPGAGERAVSGGALGHAVALVRRALAGSSGSGGVEPADWSDVTSEGLPSPEASVAVAQPGPGGSRLRVRDQWAYHSRLYRAAELVIARPDLELVQLNSFGCGVDALTTDQVQEILEGADEVYTSLKIDEVSNLGAATIRLRSLAAAAQERRRTRGQRAGAEIDTTAVPPAGAPALGAGDGAEPAVPHPDPAAPVFTEEMRRTHTILMPQFSPIHFRPLVPLMRRQGYRVELLEHASREDLEVGLRHVNNDACFPAIMVIGQLIGAFADGSHDPDRCAVGITQTGGMCRATNYAALLRKGLREAGYPQVPVVAISPQGLESNPGFRVSPSMALRLIQGAVIGDTLQTCLLRVRPYEAQEGLATALYERWNAITCEFFEHGGHSATWGGRIGYRRLVREMVSEFDALPLTDAPRRPRVGVVGEILVKFQPDANNHVVDLIEAEGCEAAVPGLTAFLLNGMVTAQWNLDNLGVGARSVRTKKAAVWFIEQVQAPALAALAACGGKFDVESPIDVMADKASQVVSLGNQAGEGWLLTAEMIELIEHGVPNIVCCQPFACLPNHVVGKGMFREMRRRYPQANIVAVDYDPGASEVNQLNRIKLMVSTALMSHGAQEGGGPGSATFAELLADLGPAPDGTPTSPDGAAAPPEALAGLGLRASR
ncbi:acyl-CoA dehydratase activase-related protein [Actinomyces howellii]|uniref:2-hydroxyglutaryl-CoA dehydratase component A n=1 Tax=Actinomyces howellii TaxID=52771 RepID=A0A3S4QZ07_9ACTO|nr:acyl-CoA dehydratase activase-related protein [Actinomyces howellii]VEG25471.1 2-hydroxyglutaryl-CoA dehydratase component A [Actinomyces howellii]